jgi:inner membrane protein
MLAAGRRAGLGRAFWIGAFAATLPDFDVFIHTGNAMRDHALHRQCTHSLLLVPVLAAIALLPLLLARDRRSAARTLYPAAFVACLSHGLLDALTSYGTQLFWPFSDTRIALDLIAVVDLFFTLPLIVGACLAWRWRSLRPVAVACMLSALYLGLATVQHFRASKAQQALIAARGVPDVRNARVLPQIGAVLCYRSIYILAGEIHADALWVSPFGAPTIKPGGSIPLLDITELHPFSPTPSQIEDFDAYLWFTGGYVARSRQHPLLLADLRYTLTPEGMEAAWTLQLEQTPTPLWRTSFSIHQLHGLLRNLFHPAGYLPIAQAAAPVISKAEPVNGKNP